MKNSKSRVVVLGSTGMLGSEVVRIAERSGLAVVPVTRKNSPKFDAEFDSFGNLISNLGIGPEDYIVNCVGWIPQKSSGDNSEDRLRAERLNHQLVKKINLAQLDLGFRWIQIGTDCVFGADRGICNEATTKDAKDLYAVSKIAGEKYVGNAMFVRCSIVGADEKSSAGLFSWFMNLPKDSRVPGYASYSWNGVSTTSFANLVTGLVRNGWEEPFFQHWIPSGTTQKSEMLQIFRAALGREDVVIQDVDFPASSRILGTLRGDFNSMLWSLAGYQSIPEIETLLTEVTSSHFERNEHHGF